MKFGKEFAPQMVPEWHEAYMNYDHLKNLLKTTPPPAMSPADQLNNPQKFHFRSFSGLTDRPRRIEPDIESQHIRVHTVNRTGSQTVRYQTTLTSEELGEFELVFFRSLDEEFNKVERFYNSKVKEVMTEAEELNKQMDALIAFRIKIENPPGFFDRRAEMNRLASDVSVSTAALSASTPHMARKSSSKRVHNHHHHMDSIDEGTSFHGQSNDVMNHQRPQEKESQDVPIIIRSAHPMEILSNVKLHDHVEPPPSTIRSFFKAAPKENSTRSFTSENLKRVEEKLKIAFVEFYHKLRLLKNYRLLNALAFSKIMKKHDKITSKETAKAYMKMVNNSYIGNAEQLTELMERVETSFVKHFANSNASTGMRVLLGPRTKRERHRVSASMGFVGGCTAALLIALILIIRARNIINNPGTTQYMETLYPLYSLFGFIVLHMLLYAGNIYFWRKYKVNYAYIFGFKQGTELGYREVLLLSFAIAVAALCCVHANLDMQMDPKTLDYKAVTELLPLILVLVMLIILFCPFNIIYRSSRFFFLRSLYHALLAPLFKVTLPDFIVADQLCSQMQAFRCIEFYICYYGWGDYKHRQSTCSSNTVFKTFYFIVAAIPYWTRMCQCLRRVADEKDVVQAVNAFKYFLAIVAVCSGTAYSLSNEVAWRVAGWVFLVSAGIICTYWDLVYDWGLLNRNSKNPWLRDKLLVPHKSIYYVAIVLNVVLRFAWVQTVIDLRGLWVHNQIITTIFACLEITRRGIWNFFRIENEHLTNVGKYRAIKSVPLPFNYDDEDDEDKDN